MNIIPATEMYRQLESSISDIKLSILILFLFKAIEEGILEAKTECYAKDKVKSPLFFRSFYDNFKSFFQQLP